MKSRTSVAVYLHNLIISLLHQRVIAGVSNSNSRAGPHNLFKKGKDGKRTTELDKSNLW